MAKPTGIILEIRMKESKSIYASLTFWGVVVAAISPIGLKHGLDMTGMESELAAAAGGIIAIYGRYRASSRVRFI